MLPLLAALEPYKPIYDQLIGMGFYNILPSQLKEPQKFANPYPLDENGGNFATVLRALKQDSPGVAVELERAIQTVTGDIEGYDVRPVGSYLTARLRHIATNENIAPWFELWQESDGTLRMLGILAALHQHPPRTLIALEEPELAIHPGALALLWEEIVLASLHTQIVITTHSPDLLDMCSAQQLRVVEKVNGVSFIGPVADEQTRIIQKRSGRAGPTAARPGPRACPGELTVSRNKVYIIVEGHGEADPPGAGQEPAAKALVTKLLEHFQFWGLYPARQRPWRLDSCGDFYPNTDRLLNVLRAHQEFDDCAAVLVLFDLDDDCPA